MPILPKFLRQSIPNAAASIRGYRTCQNTTLLNSDALRPHQSQKLSKEMRDSSCDYLGSGEYAGVNIVITEPPETHLQTTCGRESPDESECSHAKEAERRGIMVRREITIHHQESV